MKKLPLLPIRLLQDVLNRRLLFKTNRQQKIVVETITHHFFVSELGRKKLLLQPACGGAENVVKTETQQTFVNGLLGFGCFRGIYTCRKRVYCSIIVRVAHRYGQLYSHCSLIYFGFFQLFLHSDQPLSEGEIIPFSVSASQGEAALSTPEAVVASRTDWQTALMCNRRPAATSSRRASFSALASANSFVFLHRAQQHHADASYCRTAVRQLQFSGIFVALGFVVVRRYHGND